MLPTVRGSNPDRGKEFFSFPKPYHTCSGTNVPCDSFPWGKATVNMATHVSSTSAEFANEWRHTSAPPARLHVVHTDKFTFHHLF